MVTPPSTKKKKGNETTFSPPHHTARGNVTVGVVLGSGLLLTVLIYIFLYIFVDSVAQRKIDLQYQDIEYHFQEKERLVVNQMGLFRYFLMRSADFYDIETYLTQMAPAERQRFYTQLLWVSSEPAPQINRILYSREGEDPLLITRLQKLVLSEIQKQKKTLLNNRMGAFLLESPSTVRNDVVELNTNKYYFQYSYLAVVQQAVRPGGEAGYIVGLLPFKNILFMDDFFEQGKSLALMVDWGEEGRALNLYSIGKSGNAMEKIRDRGEAFESQTTRFLEQNIRFRVYIEQDYEQWVLGELPYIIPVVGILLTLLGTLYVRNNQRQATVLTRMNKILALKNMEMNSQVTERERLNQILRRTEQEKRAIMDSVSDIIFEVDQDAKLQFLNETWYRVTGFPVDQSKGMDLFEMMEPGVRDAQRKIFRQILTGEKPGAAFSIGILTVGNIYRQMRVRYSMIRLDENQNPRIVGTMTDVEEFRRTESALAEAEEKYRAIWEYAVTGIYQMTTDGHLISANPALARIFGYSSSEEMMEEVVMMNRQLYASPKERQAAMNLLMSEGRISNVEAQGVRRSGERFWLNESARVVRDSNKNVLYLEGCINDITEQKKAELHLKMALVELELANRSKTEFLANMSHELRTPLNAIIGFSEIIKEEVFGRLEQPQYREYASDICDSGRRLLGIINTILDVSQIEAGERQLNEMSIDISRLIQESADLVASRIEENNQILSFEIAQGIPKFWGEELAIKQILLNLLTNAVKFTPAGGRITIAAKVDGAGDLRLSVVDTGIGMSDEEVQRVLAPFGQSSGSLARSSSGASLGLTLVNSLIHLHGGHFEMISKKDVGTTATVILPANRLRK